MADPSDNALYGGYFPEPPRMLSDFLQHPSTANALAAMPSAAIMAQARNMLSAHWKVDPLGLGLGLMLRAGSVPAQLPARPQPARHMGDAEYFNMQRALDAADGAIFDFRQTMTRKYGEGFDKLWAPEEAARMQSMIEGWNKLQGAYLPHSWARARQGRVVNAHDLPAMWEAKTGEMMTARPPYRSQQLTDTIADELFSAQYPWGTSRR